MSVTVWDNPRGLLVIVKLKRRWWQRLRRRSDLITGAVTYGGVAMTRAVEDPRSSYIYYFRSGIPTEPEKGEAK